MTFAPHHQQTIDRLADAYRDDPRFPALIIGGSVAKGFARPDSDVDFMIVATDEYFAECKAKHDMFINRTDLCDDNYPGHGYVDGKIIDLSFLKQVAEKGNDPSRAAFNGAFTAYSHIPNLDDLLNSIPVYPEHEHDKRIKAFYCSAFMGHWLMNESTRHDNRYAIVRAASQLALYTGRLILAHNRMLYPFHKWLMRTLEDAPQKPVGLINNINALLENPNADTATTLFEQVQSFHDWGITDLEAYTWFMTEVEWSWMTGSTPIEDW